MAYADSCESRLLLSKIGTRGQVGYPHVVLRGYACVLFYDKERGNSHGQNGEDVIPYMPEYAKQLPFSRADPFQLGRMGVSGGGGT
jgi:hypothetical protein